MGNERDEAIKQARGYIGALSDRATADDEENIDYALQAAFDAGDHIGDRAGFLRGLEAACQATVKFLGTGAIRDAIRALAKENP